MACMMCSVCLLYMVYLMYMAIHGVHGAYGVYGLPAVHDVPCMARGAYREPLPGRLCIHVGALLTEDGDPVYAAFEAGEGQG